MHQSVGSTLSSLFYRATILISFLSSSSIPLAFSFLFLTTTPDFRRRSTWRGAILVSQGPWESPLLAPSHSAPSAVQSSSKETGSRPPVYWRAHWGEVAVLAVRRFVARWCAFPQPCMMVDHWCDHQQPQLSHLCSIVHQRRLGVRTNRRLPYVSGDLNFHG